MTTTIATVHHSATSSHPCLTQSAPENMAEKKPPEITLFMLCISMAINTHPLVLLNTHVNTTVQATMTNGSESWI